MKKFPYSLKELQSGKIDLIELTGVGLTVKDSQGNLFLVLEKEKKAWKKPGQWSTVMETYKDEDECLLTTVKRGLQEELGIDIDTGEKIWSEDLMLVSYVCDSKKNKIYKVYLYLYDIALTEQQSEQALNFINGEIEKVKLVPLEDVISGGVGPLRPGTKEILLGTDSPFFIVDGELLKY